eukprot:scaffold10013_cov45-Isochrysis_galbana.AAC.1
MCAPVCVRVLACACVCVRARARVRACVRRCALRPGRPKSKPSHLDAAHQRESRFQAVEPDIGQVAANDWKGQVLHETGEAEAAGGDEGDAEGK